MALEQVKASLADERAGWKTGGEPSEPALEIEKTPAGGAVVPFKRTARAPSRITELSIPFGAFTFMRTAIPPLIHDGEAIGSGTDRMWIGLKQQRGGELGEGGAVRFAGHWQDDLTRRGDPSIAWLLISFPVSKVAPAGKTALDSGTMGCAAGRLMGNHIRLLARLLPTASQTDLPLFAEATSSLLFACLTHAAPGEDGSAHGKAAVRRSEVERVIRQNLSSARLDADRLSELAGFSRSAIYRLFVEDGGVARYIRALRLDLVRSDLADPAIAHLTIAEIAQRRGLYCTSSFIRSFRQAFGCTPGAVRSEALAGREGRAAPADARPAGF